MSVGFCFQEPNLGFISGVDIIGLELETASQASTVMLTER
jgi:hypothetical protein